MALPAVIASAGCRATPGCTMEMLLNGDSDRLAADHALQTGVCIMRSPVQRATSRPPRFSCRQTLRTPWMRKLSSNIRAAAAWSSTSRPARSVSACRRRCWTCWPSCAPPAKSPAVHQPQSGGGASGLRRGGGDVPRTDRRAGPAPSGSSARRVIPILRCCWRRCRASTLAPCRLPRRANRPTRPACPGGTFHSRCRLAEPACRTGSPPPLVNGLAVRRPVFRFE